MALRGRRPRAFGMTGYSCQVSVRVVPSSGVYGRQLMTEHIAAGKADIGVTGLAVMGRNLARNLARHGHVVALHNRTFARTQSLLAEAGTEGTFVASESLEGFVASLARPRAIIVMVQAGLGTDAVI